MNPYLKTLIWVVIWIILVTHPTIITTVFHSLSVFATTVKQGSSGG